MQCKRCSSLLRQIYREGMRYILYCQQPGQSFQGHKQRILYCPSRQRTCQHYRMYMILARMKLDTYRLCNFGKQLNRHLLQMYQEDKYHSEY